MTASRNVRSSAGLHCTWLILIKPPRERSGAASGYDAGQLTAIKRGRAGHAIVHWRPARDTADASQPAQCRHIREPAHRDLMSTPDRNNRLSDAKAMLARRSDDFLFQPAATLTALCILFLFGCTQLPDKVVQVHPAPSSYGRDYPDNFTEAGHKIALERCASCHAVDRISSPNRRAPPLNTLLVGYDASQLADNLLAGNRVGHDGMPAFDFNMLAVVSLIAYLESIGPEPARRVD